MTKKIILFILITLSLIACSSNNNVFFYQKINFPNHTWHYDSLAAFTVPISDTSTYYNIAYEITHDAEYPYANLWIKEIVKFPCGRIKIDTINIWFIDTKKRWIGRGINNIWTINTLVWDSIKFPKPGNYTFYFQHIMRKNNIGHLISFALVINKLPKTKNSNK